MLLALTLLLLFHTSLSSTLIYDNVDPRIVYSGSWQAFSATGGDDLGGTLAFSNEDASIATLQFTGTSVTVYGALKPIGTWNMHSVYYLDDLPADGFIPPTQVTSEQHRLVFYSSGRLANGQHTLKI
ncbi:hypothetical protein C8Q77DRAFT_1055954, partial [Trametes polyzona]